MLRDHQSQTKEGDSYESTYPNNPPMIHNPMAMTIDQHKNVAIASATVTITTPPQINPAADPTLAHKD